LRELNTEIQAGIYLDISGIMLSIASIFSA